MSFIKRTLHVVGLIFVTLFTVIIFLPKDQLFFLVERELQVNGVNLKYESIKDGIFDVKVDSVVIYYMGSEVARMKKLDISVFGVNGENIKFNGIAQKSLGDSAEYIKLKVSPEIIDAKGSFGVASGKLDLQNFSLKFRVTPSSVFKRDGSVLLNNLRKDGGDYVYDYKI